MSYSCPIKLGDTAQVNRYYPRQYGVSVPLAFVVPQDTCYEVRIPTYPIPNQVGLKLWTGQPSYLNAVGNDIGQPLHFMAYKNLQRY
jgi:hypothetical protein